MKPVELKATNIAGKFAAGGKIAFGAVVQRSAAGEVKAAVPGTHAMIGIAVDDPLTKDVDGFYSDGNNVPIVTGGTCRVWMLGGTLNYSGGFVKLIPIEVVGTVSDHIGICTKETNATTRTTATIGRIIGNDVGDEDDDQAIVSDAAAGQKVITMDATKMTAINLSAGDYILVSDETTGSEVQVVDSVTSTTITCKENLVFTYVVDAETLVYKLVQADVELM